MSLTRGNQLSLGRCPHCSVAKPAMPVQWSGKSTNSEGRNKRDWSVYSCTTCGGHVLTCSVVTAPGEILDIWPAPRSVAESVPERARNYLEQAISSLHSPAGAVMLAASAIDAMLKAKGLRDGSLYNRIDQASNDGLITSEMALWAHEVRIDANDQRHADEKGALPSEVDAERVIDFTSSLAQFLFVLPARVASGRARVSD